MKFALLYNDDCANWVEAGRRVEVALAAVGRSAAELEYLMVRRRGDAVALGFGGSPTITVDGLDLFPLASRPSESACRVYATPHGLAGLPTVAQVTEAIS